MLLRRTTNAISLLLLIVGAGLLALTAWGQSRPPQAVVAEGPADGFHQPSGSLADVRRLLEMDSPASPDRDWLVAAHRTVADGLAHGLVERKPVQSWVLWTGSRMTKSNYLATQDPNVILEARRGYCSQTAAVLKHIVERAGLSARFLDFEGHVALEVEVDGEWLVADTDYDVLYPFSVLQLAEPASRPAVVAALAARGFEPDTIEGYLKVVQDGPAIRRSIGEEHDPVAWRYEQLGMRLTWLLPLASIVMGLALLGLGQLWSRRMLRSS